MNVIKPPGDPGSDTNSSLIQPGPHTSGPFCFSGRIS